MAKYFKTFRDKIQSRYHYQLIEAESKNFDPKFKPELTPKQMLELGIFGGVYFFGSKKLIPSDLPKSWFAKAKLAPDVNRRKELNYFGVFASQPMRVWQKKGWISPLDPYGWFQWYCRYYLGRRTAEEDSRQIKRWLAMKRHISQIINNCHKGDLSCHRGQRQAVLHWAYDSRKI